MFTFAIAALAFASEPSSAARVPFRPRPRFMQAGTVPGWAEPPLAAPPAILNITVNPPAPFASYVVTVVYDPVFRLWIGTVPGGVKTLGSKIGFLPYAPNQFLSRDPPSADQFYCRIAFLNGGGLGDWGGGIVRVNTDAPYTAGPLPWGGNAVTTGYSFTIGP